MRGWVVMLGGLLVWTAHFVGVYAIASVGAVVSDADGPAARWAIGGLTLLCVLAIAALAVFAERRARTLSDDLARFMARLSVLGATFAGLAVVWQGLPALF